MYELYTDSIFNGENMKQKLIIWDFDGVIADTEKLWVQNRMEMLNEKFGLNWNFETAYKIIGGMSDKTKRETLETLGISTDDDFWQEAMRQDMLTMQKGFALTPGIEDIFKLEFFEQCIATGGVFKKTEKKIEMVGIGKYFPPEKVFTADLVEYGKPEPDLFLLAADTMGYKPENCIVIEDSLAGMYAGLRAKMTTIAFTGYEANASEHYLQKIKEAGIKYIFSSMIEIKKFLLQPEILC